MKFLIVDKLSNVAQHHRRSVLLWFFYHFITATLCVINILFFICNWGDLHIDINDSTNILLTIIGFLFAFAGINIYSIFNTNIESEKRKLIELQDVYNRQTIKNVQQMKFSSLLNQQQLYAQLIFSSSKMNIQILEWASVLVTTLTEIEKYLELLKKQESCVIYEQYRNDVLSLCRGFSYQGRIFLETISSKDSLYFDNISKGYKSIVVDTITNLICKFSSLFPEGEEKIVINRKETNMCAKIKTFFNGICNAFVRKY